MGESEEGDGSMPDISGDRSLRDRDYNPEQVIIIIVIITIIIIVIIIIIVVFTIVIIAIIIRIKT